MLCVQSESNTLESPAPKPFDQGKSLAVAVRRHRLVAEIDRRLKRQCGFWSTPVQSRRDRTLLVGVSGGADSTALLLACIVLRDRYRQEQHSEKHAFRLAASYVHHHLRPEADDEASWVADLCKTCKGPFILKLIYPGQFPGNLPAQARDLR